LATEAAVAVLDFAFRRLAFDEVIAIVHPANTRSQRVAQKLGMDIEQQVKNPVLARGRDRGGRRSTTVTRPARRARRSPWQ
jgi:RimJ/RimL family protein N-acetyltransferase